MMMLIGAMSKSALIPFHFWLPGAMAAPTPISAYLHAAAMVVRRVPRRGAGPSVLDGAVLAAGRAFAGCRDDGRRRLWRALRQTDLKLLLAYGTVLGLGFMVFMVGMGTQAAARSCICRHGDLTCAVQIDAVHDRRHHRSLQPSTRDLTKLSGVMYPHVPGSP